MHLVFKIISAIKLCHATNYTFRSGNCYAPHTVALNISSDLNRDKMSNPSVTCLKFYVQDEEHQRKWLDGRRYDNPADSAISMQPMIRYMCTAEGECSQSDVNDSFFTILDDPGKCSALFTREGFLDFVFKTQCDVVNNVAVVCQHDQKVKLPIRDHKSDVKVTTFDGFYSLEVFSSCDPGWFMVDNMCINFYCSNCASNSGA